MKPLLFPCSVLRRETLPAAMERAGIPLQCLACYNTVAHPDVAENIRSLFQSKVHVRSHYSISFQQKLHFAQLLKYWHIIYCTIPCTYSTKYMYMLDHSICDSSIRALYDMQWALEVCYHWILSHEFTVWEGLAYKASFSVHPLSGCHVLKWQITFVILPAML
jgi:hypothetical protein